MLYGKANFLLVGQNVWWEWVLVGQIRILVGQCPMSDRYFKPCILAFPFPTKNVLNICILKKHSCEYDIVSTLCENMSQLQHYTSHAVCLNLAFLQFVLNIKIISIKLFL